MTRSPPCVIRFCHQRPALRCYWWFRRSRHPARENRGCIRFCHQRQALRRYWRFRRSRHPARDDRSCLWQQQALRCYQWFWRSCHYHWDDLCGCLWFWQPSDLHRARDDRLRFGSAEHGISCAARDGRVRFGSSEHCISCADRTTDAPADRTTDAPAEHRPPDAGAPLLACAWPTKWFAQTIWGSGRFRLQAPVAPTDRPTRAPVVVTERPTRVPVIVTVRPTRAPVVVTERPTRVCLIRKRLVCILVRCLTESSAFVFASVAGPGCRHPAAFTCARCARNAGTACQCCARTCHHCRGHSCQQRHNGSLSVADHGQCTRIFR